MVAALSITAEVCLVAVPDFLLPRLQLASFLPLRHGQPIHWIA